VGVLLYLAMRPPSEAFINLATAFPSKDIASEATVREDLAWSAQPTRCFSCQHQVAAIEPALGFREGPQKCFSCERQVGARSFYTDVI
jgi:hypothetical protein